MRDCDFIPYEYRERSSQRGALKLRASLIGAMVALMVFWVTAHNSELASAEAMHADAAEQLTQIDILLARKTAMEERRKHLDRLERLVIELKAPASLVVVLGDLSRRMPDSVILTDIDIDSLSILRFAAKQAGDGKEGDAEKRSPKTETDSHAEPTRLVVSGLALDTTDAIRFSAAMESSPLFEDVQMTLKGPEEWGGRRGEGFKVSCNLPKHERTAP